ncbi:MAG: glycosyltransferase [Eubacteriales bacterium]|nr:glycosyltransferase [Eubacteriales bacterium]
MKQIFFITPNLANGGAEHITALLANGLAQRGKHVVVLCMKDHKRVFPLDSSVPIVSLFDARGGIGKIPRKVLRLRRMMKQYPEATFVAMLPYETLYTFLASIGLRRRMVYSLRNDPAHMKGLLHWFIWNAVYPTAHCVVFQTEEACHFFPDRVREKGVVIPNPIETNLPRRFTEERRHEVVTVGRLTRQKNIPMLLRAFAQVHAAHTDWTLKIYGEGPLRAELEQLREQLGLTEAVSFCGFVDHVAEQINQSGMFVLASTYEGISNAMLEALATGVPCICTDCPAGGARMMIQSGENGILVPVNGERELADAMLALIEHPELAERYSRAAVRRCASLSEQNILEQWEQVL